MAKARTLVGLDVHATKIVAAVLDAETGQLQTFRMSGESEAAAGFCAGLPRPVRVAYEAGPTGYGRTRAGGGALGSDALPASALQAAAAPRDPVR